MLHRWILSGVSSSSFYLDAEAEGKVSEIVWMRSFEAVCIQSRQYQLMRSQAARSVWLAKGVAGMVDLSGERCG